MSQKQHALETSPLVVEQQKEQIKVREITFLLQHLSEREEETVRYILDRLYDIGVVNLINHKVHPRLLNRGLKRMAPLPKPIIRVLAIRWFQKNCPHLIADWLHSKVTFADPCSTESSQEASQTPEDKDAIIAQQQKQLSGLQNQVKWLSGGLIVMTVVAIVMGTDLHFDLLLGDETRSHLPRATAEVRIGPNRAQD